MNAKQMLLMKDLTDSQKIMLQSEFKEKSVGTAYLFWFIFGVYYGYLGKWGTQVLFWITFAGIGIWGFIDLFRMKSIVEKVNDEIFNEAYTKVKAFS